jgi:hypothetical protein
VTDEVWKTVAQKKKDKVKVDPASIMNISGQMV